MPDFDPTEQAFLAHASPLPDCPPFEVLMAAGQSVLPEAIEMEVTAHIASCTICQFLLHDIESLPERPLTADESARILNRMPHHQVHPQRRWSIVAAAAAVLVVAASVVAYHPWRTANQDAAQKAAIAPTTQRAPVQVALTRLPPDRSLITGLVFRGAHSTDEPSATELEPAFAAYMKDHYDAAAQHFSHLSIQYPKADTPVLYLGVSQLFIGQNQAAFASLTRAEELATPAHRDAASWYHAIAALRLNSGDAGELFQALCQRGASSYSKKACNVFSQLHPEAPLDTDK